MKNKAKNQIRILIVEDDEVAQFAANEQLKKLDCITDIAATGKEAIALFETHSYDLIFMDIAILDMDGFTITKAFRTVEDKQNRSHVPIFAVSAYDDDSFKKRAQAIGIENYLVKPVTIKKYQEILDTFFP